jgi:iron complex outermembrane receptor protein
MNKSVLLSLATCSFLHADMDNFKELDSNIAEVSQGIVKQENSDKLSDALNMETGIIISDDSMEIRGIGDDGRGVSVVDDGDSQTDISGAFTFDIDTEELESLVVYKGPGSIYSVNGTGGAIQAISNPIFKKTDSVKVGLGSYGYEYFKANVHEYVDLNNVVSVSFTQKNEDKDYMEHSEVESSKFDIKYGHMIDDSSSIEFGYNYSDTDKNQIQKIDDENFELFKNDETVLNDGIWDFNKDDRQIRTSNIKYKKYFGDDLLKVSSFYKTMDRVQLQDGKIKTFGDNYNFGFDAEYEFSRDKSEYVLGFSYKKDKMEDQNSYTYDDIIGGSLSSTVGASGSAVTSVTGTTLGELLATANNDNNLFAIYGKHEYMINSQTKLESSLRVDRVAFDVDNISYYSFNSTTEKYKTEDGLLDTVTTLNTLVTPRIALTYAVNNYMNLYASVAQGEQTATDTQLLANMRNGKSTDFEVSQARNYETGIKYSNGKFIMQGSIYKIKTKDEFIEIKDATGKYYENAGSTSKKGLELSAKYNLNSNYYVGTNYSLYDYKYDEYDAGTTGDFSGNTMAEIPDYTYALYVGYKDPMQGFRTKVEFVGSGEYYIDRENTRSYDGYDFVTNIMFGYEPKMDHTLMLNVNNVFDKRYATEVVDASGINYYTLGSPQQIIVSYKYNF